MDKSTGAHKKSDTDRETHVAKLPAHIFSADVNKTFTDLVYCISEMHNFLSNSDG